MTMLETLLVAVIPIAMIGPPLYFLGVQTGASREAARRDDDVDRILGIGERR